MRYVDREENFMQIDLDVDLRVSYVTQETD